MIRAADYDDIADIVELAKEFHAESKYSSYTFDEEYLIGNIQRILDTGVVFLAIIDNKVVGGFMGAVTSQWFTPDKIGYDYSLYIKKEHRHGIISSKLIYAFEHWCKSQGAQHVQLGITTGINVEGTARFFERLGYSEHGPLYQKRIL